MEQMRRPEIPTVEEAQYWRLNGAFFRRKGDNTGLIFFGATRGGGEQVYCFRINEDGTVKKSSDIVALYPTETVEIINPKDIGINEITWAE